jgi:hypothetical protein
MRKPSKLGFCTTCDAKIFVFDAHGTPFKKRGNYREVAVVLTDNTTSKIAVCDKCLSNGLCAEEAMLNCLDGMKRETEKASWGQNFKDWFFSQYENLKIKEVLSASRHNWKDGKMINQEVIGDVVNLSDENPPEKPRITLEALKEFTNGNRD